MFKKFDLIQYTPLIHFETKNVLNPTIRPTELKSKFDKFLIRQCKNLKPNIDEKGRKYLKYKIIIDSDAKMHDFSNGSLYFGNMGGENKKYSLASNLKVTFFTFDKTLLNCIENNFKKFLANTNFGSRQSKGFGSFFIKDKKFDINLIEASKVYKITISNAFSKIITNKKNNTKEYKWRNHLSLFYQFLRQGINLPRRSNPFYTKPIIFSYALNNGWIWEKKVIKQHCFSDALNQQQKNHPNSQPLHSNGEEYIIRDLLGLSTDQRWMSYHKNIKKENSHIKRFKSPIIFKPVLINENKMDIYFFKDPREEEKIEDFLNKTFKIRVGGCGFDLSTPPSFDIDKFLEFAKNIKLSQHIDNSFHNTNEFEILREIYQTFQRVK